MEKIPVAILAGKPPERDKLLHAADVDNKVLIEYKGKTLLQIAMDAVADSNRASKLVLVGISEDELPFDISGYTMDLFFYPIQGEQFDKIYEGAKYIVDTFTDEDFSHILYMSADMPHLHGEVITDYLDRVQQDTSADLYYSIVHKDVVTTALPDFDWGYMKIKDGQFVSGNLTYIRPEKLLDKYDMIKFLSQNRKSFIWGVLKASPWMFLKLIFGRITLKEAEKLMTSYFGVTSRVIVSPYYELSFDMDQPEDIEFIQNLS